MGKSIPSELFESIVLRCLFFFLQELRSSNITSFFKNSRFSVQMVNSGSQENLLF